MKQEDDLVNDLTRDAYAHFGLAYYLSECVFQGLVQVLATDGIGVTRGSVEERTAQYSKYTLGPLVDAAKKVLPVDCHSDLDNLVERRNFLAHGFWFDRVHQMTSQEGLQRLIEELQRDQELFRRLSRLTDEVVIPRLFAAGITAQMWETMFLEAQNAPPEQSPSRPLPRAGAKLRIIRAWFVPSGSLVFEDESGKLWQPSETGLGWYVGEVDPAWPPAKFSSLLPASVVARPKSATPWNYTLEFFSGFQLRVSHEEQSKKPTVKLQLPPVNSDT